MKALNKHKKVMAQFMMFLILCQSCVLYKSTPITMDEAVKNESKVMVKTNNNEILKFKRIGFENGDYYGLKHRTGKIAKMPLEKETITSIREKDRALSTIVTIGMPLLILLSAAIMVEESLSFELGGY
ncbi:hypothetical protein WJN01_14880 [Flavobacteriaceae bacterium SZ-1-7]|uniref:hypothetical protein n=1 Tax=Tamlana sedimenti TaxID=3134126 RepID=UPI0031246C16